MLALNHSAEAADGQQVAAVTLGPRVTFELQCRVAISEHGCDQIALVQRAPTATPDVEREVLAYGFHPRQYDVPNPRSLRQR
jgi:hypothetical protein